MRNDRVAGTIVYKESWGGNGGVLRWQRRSPEVATVLILYTRFSACLGHFYISRVGKGLKKRKERNEGVKRQQKKPTAIARQDVRKEEKCCHSSVRMNHVSTGYHSPKLGVSALAWFTPERRHYINTAKKCYSQLALFMSSSWPWMALNLIS